MKKLPVLALAIILILALSGCQYEESYGPLGTLESGYVTAIDGDTVYYNEVEIVYEGTDRARELVGYEDMEDGYMIYDTDSEIKTLELYDDATYNLLRWNEEDKDYKSTEVTRDEFVSEMESHAPDGFLCSMSLGEKVTNISEFKPRER